MSEGAHAKSKMPGPRPRRARQHRARRTDLLEFITNSVLSVIYHAFPHPPTQRFCTARGTW